jgi:hypothetical protein
MELTGAQQTVNDCKGWLPVSGGLQIQQVMYGNISNFSVKIMLRTYIMFNYYPLLS